MRRLIEMLSGMGNRRANRAGAVAMKERRRASRNAVLGLEGMEERKMLTAGVSLAAGVLTVTGTEHGDTVAFTRSYDYSQSMNLVNVTWTHDNVTNHASYSAYAVNKLAFIGGAGDDWVTNGTDISSYLYGGAGNNYLLGGGGKDRITAGIGNDFLVGGAGDDIITGEGGNNTIIGNDGDDVLFATDKLEGDGFRPSNTNSIYGGNGNDTIFGSTWGVNNLYGGAGNDVIVGKAHSSNSMFGEDGNDTLIGSGDFNLENGGKGVDIMEALAPGSISILDGGDDDDFDYFFNQGLDTSVYTLLVTHPKDASSGGFISPPSENIYGV